jgi:hypothetical protein
LTAAPKRYDAIIPKDEDDALSRSAASLSIPSLAEDWNSPEDQVWDKDEG